MRISLLVGALHMRLSGVARAQPGDRYRSFDPARRERFVARIAGMLSDPRCTQACPSAHCRAAEARVGLHVDLQHGQLACKELFCPTLTLQRC